MGRRIASLKPNFSKNPFVCGSGVRLIDRRQVSSRESQSPPTGVELPAQVSSEHDSKLGNPSQNSPPVASKRDVNITKLNQKETPINLSQN
ncbi:hypothetical protein AVEN_42670-1 [Araneus ventricosus]|uniref:Uncharacterized protein n=1 Tax=Araneus ventricosus TaxID=182803 RepID=A0A4Y2BP58_ARAVE|nr:hypothetical protein AVEN_42670-1 [Araneus ventricosus]